MVAGRVSIASHIRAIGRQRTPVVILLGNGVVSRDVSRVNETLGAQPITWLTPGWNAEVTRAEIEEADELAAADGQSLCEKHGADPKAFKKALKVLDDESARALRVVVTEFWRDNKSIAKRLGYER